MPLLRHIIWIVVAVLALANWVMKERWLGEFWMLAIAGSVVALLALAAWVALDWRKGRDLSKKLEHTGEPPQRR